MFTIKQAAARTGVSEASLRAWDRRYGIGTPHRSQGGYRLYDEPALDAIRRMRTLVDEGWSPAAAAAEVAAGAHVAAGAEVWTRAEVAAGGTRARRAAHATALPAEDAAALTEELLDAAAVVDAVVVESVLERAFALGPFESVVDDWLMPTLRAVGEAWAEGWIDVAGEHAAAHAVTRRLSRSFAAAPAVPRGPRVVVALPAGSLHELGALAFATAVRRRGMAAVYLGADLPVESWVRAVEAFPTRATVLGVVTPEDRPTALRTVEALLAARPDIPVAVGGAHSSDLAPGVLELPARIGDAALALESLPR